MKYTTKVEIEVELHKQDPAFSEKQIRKAVIAKLRELHPEEVLASSNQPFHQFTLEMDKYRVVADVCVDIPEFSIFGETED